MANPSRLLPASLLVTELWGVGDLALAVPFLQVAAQHTRVTLLARPHAGPILTHFAPTVELIPWVAPWTAFAGKYRLASWPWRELRTLLGRLRRAQFSCGVSARPDPRDHALLTLAGVHRRLGFPRAGFGWWLHDALPKPALPHRRAHWESLAHALGWSLPPARERVSSGRCVALHPGAARAVRRWPRERFAMLAERLEAAGWTVRWIEEEPSLEHLLATLAQADRFLGNDSGPGHLAALLGIPTFTIFGPQLPALFAPAHPRAAWVEGAPCDYKPCFDACHFSQPHCLLQITVDQVWPRLAAWIDAPFPSPGGAW